MKFTSLLICTSMILSLSVPCFAQAETKDTQIALSEVKTRLDIGDFENFQSEYRTDKDGNTQYYFDWEENEDNEYEYISVVYSNGVITGYDHSFSGEYSNDFKISQISVETAKEIAEEFIKKANPDVYQNIQVIDDNQNEINTNSYYFSLIRTENGIPVIGSSGNISVSKSTNKVRYFHISYDSGIDFIKNENLLSEEDGKKAYSENLAPILKYAYNYDYSKKELSVFAKFESCDSDLMINALSGNVYEVPENLYRYSVSGSNNSKEEAIMDAEASVKFSPAELSEFEKISGLMSEKDAEKKIRENKILNLDKELKTESVRLVRNYINEEKYSYNFSFAKDAEDKYDYADVLIDAKTGEVLNFYKSGDYSKKDAQKTDVELKKADEALKAFAPEKYSEFKVNKTENTGNVSYARMYNGIEVSGDYASFSFDGNDDLVSYSLNYTDIEEFPSLENVLTVKEAFNKACENIDFSLAYSVDYEKKIATPVYCFLENDRTAYFNLDANTGALIDYSGEEIKEEDLISYSDISGHYAEDKFLKLASFGIGFSGDKLNPEAEITQAEYFMLLNDVFGYASDIEEVYKSSFLDGIITKEERDDNSPVTREDAAIFMIKEMGADEYAKYDEIFATPFSDVFVNKGYIGLLKAFGVVSGDGNGKFYPEQTITRGEALIMIYNYLDR